jgi:chromate reductase, NAD(P)H dehydrogenase (quinone)
MNLLCLSGSLRAASTSRVVVATVCERLEGVTTARFDIGTLPHYNADLELPATVAAFKSAIEAADGLVIVTPEYNYSVPGVLKNAIDWGSRPPNQPFNEKPIAIMGASPGVIGTARAQYHLRQCFVFLNSWVVNKPEVMLGAANTRFNEAGELIDDNAKKLIADLLQALMALARKVKAA